LFQYKITQHLCGTVVCLSKLCSILGALTGKQGIAGKQVGKIHIFNNWAYVAIHRDVIRQALKKLGQGQLKGRSFRVRLIRE